MYREQAMPQLPFIEAIIDDTRDELRRAGVSEAVINAFKTHVDSDGDAFVGFNAILSFADNQQLRSIAGTSSEKMGLLLGVAIALRAALKAPEPAQLEIDELSAAFNERYRIAYTIPEALEAQQSNISRRGGRKESRLAEVIRGLIQSSETTFAEVIDGLETLAEDNQSGIEEVDRENETVTYFSRADILKTVKFKTVKNHISNIKKSFK